jgi:cobyric acid synthase
LPLDTCFGAEKHTARVVAVATETTFLAPAGERVEGYEIHMGRVTARDGRCAFRVETRHGRAAEGVDGSVSGAVVGTMLHGLLENARVREHLVGTLRARRGLRPLVSSAFVLADPFDALAVALREHLRMDVVRALLRGEGAARP